MTMISSPQKSPAREIAISVNVAMALLCALQNFCGEGFLSQSNLRAADFEKGIQELLHVRVHSSSSVRV